MANMNGTRVAPLVVLVLLLGGALVVSGRGLDDPARDMRELDEIDLPAEHTPVLSDSDTEAEDPDLSADLAELADPEKMAQAWEKEAEPVDAAQLRMEEFIPSTLPSPPRQLDSNGQYKPSGEKIDISKYGMTVKVYSDGKCHTKDSIAAHPHSSSTCFDFKSKHKRMSATFQCSGRSDKSGWVATLYGNSNCTGKPVGTSSGLHSKHCRQLEDLHHKKLPISFRVHCGQALVIGRHKAKSFNRWPYEKLDKVKEKKHKLEQQKAQHASEQQQKHNAFLKHQAHKEKLSKEHARLQEQEEKKRAAFEAKAKAADRRKARRNRLQKLLQEYQAQIQHTKKQIDAAKHKLSQAKSNETASLAAANRTDHELVASIKKLKALEGKIQVAHLKMMGWGIKNLRDHAKRALEVQISPKLSKQESAMLEHVREKLKEADDQLRIVYTYLMDLSSAFTAASSHVVLPNAKDIQHLNDQLTKLHKRLEEEADKNHYYNAQLAQHQELVMHHTRTIQHYESVIRQTSAVITTLRTLMDRTRHAGVCVPACAHGLCVATYKTDKNGTIQIHPVCKCHDGWTGNGCNQPVCSPTCVHGNCTGPNKCTCHYGWGGDRCGLPTSAKCAPRCTSHGTCVVKDICVAKDGCTGKNCTAECTAKDLCHCQPGWSGPTCAKATGAQCVPVCKHGVCGVQNGFSVCKCAKGWSGADCSIPKCTPTCKNGGKCVGPNLCKCAKGWGGLTCGFPHHSNCSWPGCGNHGVCETKVHCKTKDSCVGVHCKSVCEPLSTCKCKDGFKGKHCHINPNPVCRPGCGPNGICMQGGVCKCKKGWTGPKCMNAYCHPGCRHGTCVGPNQCKCKRGYTGSSCGMEIVYKCHPTCSSHGKCKLVDICKPIDECVGKSCKAVCAPKKMCKCHPGWYGPRCQFGPPPVCKPSCGYGGQCLEGNKCECEPGFSGDRCEFPPKLDLNVSVKVKVPQDELGFYGRPTVSVDTKTNCATAAGEKGPACDPVQKVDSHIQVHKSSVYFQGDDKCLVTPWQPWGSCVNNVQTRIRTVEPALNSACKEVVTVERRLCTCVIGNWSLWSECTNRTQMRTRQLQPVEKCTHVVHTERRRCLPPQPGTGDCKAGNWSKWGHCHLGVQTRERVVPFTPECINITHMEEKQCTHNISEPSIPTGSSNTDIYANGGSWEQTAGVVDAEAPSKVPEQVGTNNTEAAALPRHGIKVSVFNDNSCIGMAQSSTVRNGDCLVLTDPQLPLEVSVLVHCTSTSNDSHWRAAAFASHDCKGSELTRVSGVNGTGCTETISNLPHPAPIVSLMVDCSGGAPVIPTKPRQPDAPAPDATPSPRAVPNATSNATANASTSLEQHTACPVEHHCCVAPNTAHVMFHGEHLASVQVERTMPKCGASFHPAAPVAPKQVQTTVPEGLTVTAQISGPVEAHNAVSLPCPEVGQCCRINQRVHYRGKLEYSIPPHSAMPPCDQAEQVTEHTDEAEAVEPRIPSLDDAMDETEGHALDQPFHECPQQERCCVKQGSVYFRGEALAHVLPHHTMSPCSESSWTGADSTHMEPADHDQTAGLLAPLVDAASLELPQAGDNTETATRRRLLKRAREGATKAVEKHLVQLAKHFVQLGETQIAALRESE